MHNGENHSSGSGAASTAIATTAMEFGPVGNPGNGAAPAVD